jgi:hypothetical protein
MWMFGLWDLSLTETVKHYHKIQSIDHKFALMQIWDKFKMFWNIKSKTTTNLAICLEIQISYARASVM